jgi:hypothetical protein
LGGGWGLAGIVRWLWVNIYLDAVFGEDSLLSCGNFFGWFYFIVLVGRLFLVSVGMRIFEILHRSIPLGLVVCGCGGVVDPLEETVKTVRNLVDVFCGGMIFVDFKQLFFSVDG